MKREGKVIILITVLIVCLASYIGLTYYQEFNNKETSDFGGEESKKERFEYNVFWDLKQGRQPLIIVELEIDNIGKKISLPEHIGKEITFNSQYYGYKLFEKLMQKNMSN